MTEESKMRAIDSNVQQVEDATFEDSASSSSSEADRPTSLFKPSDEMTAEEKEEELLKFKKKVGVIEK